MILTAVDEMAAVLAEHYPAWHGDPFSFQAFAAVIGKFLRLYRPEGEPEPKPKTADRLFNEKATTVDSVSGFLAGAASHSLHALRRYQGQR